MSVSSLYYYSVFYVNYNLSEKTHYIDLLGTGLWDTIVHTLSKLGRTGNNQ